MTNSNEEPKILVDWRKVFIDRSEFLKLVGFVCSGVIGLVMAIPAVAFIINYFFVPRQREWINIGATDQFKQGETVHVVFDDPYALPWDGVAGRRAAWLRRVDDTQYEAFAINCTHLGCPVRWEPGAHLFMCPCHGGVYYSNGDVAGGPPPRPLDQYPVRVRDGQVEIKVGPFLVES